MEDESASFSTQSCSRTTFNLPLSRVFDSRDGVTLGSAEGSTEGRSHGGGFEGGSSESSTVGSLSDERRGSRGVPRGKNDGNGDEGEDVVGEGGESSVVWRGAREGREVRSV